MTVTSAQVVTLLSYSATDWAVTSGEETRILALLEADANLSLTIRDLERAGMLLALLQRVDSADHASRLFQLLGGRLDSGARSLISNQMSRWQMQYHRSRALPPASLSQLNREFFLSAQLQDHLTRRGLITTSARFNRSHYAGIVGTSPTQPFSGSGATGVNPTSLSIPLTDQARLAVRHAATVRRYSNPIPGSLPAYLRTLTPAQRMQQAQLLLLQPVISMLPHSYGSRTPSRADIVRAAAKAHNLHPQVVAAFLLAEQRDQSRNEDAKDYGGAVSVLQGNTSIGLGQVVVSTARRHDLFADLLDASTRNSLSHQQIAQTLTSDEFNIFAVARYMRLVANQGARIPISRLPRTQAMFPAIDMGKYGGKSNLWPDDNIRALASEYTSRAWDDRLSLGWANFVFEAYRNVNASGVF